MSLQRFLRRNRGYVAFVWLSLGVGLAIALGAAMLLRVESLWPIAVRPIVHPTAIADTTWATSWSDAAWTASQSQQAGVDSLVAVLSALAAVAAAMALVNVLMVASGRALGRRRENAVRAALGATPRAFRIRRLHQSTVLYGGAISIGIVAAAVFWSGMQATWPPGLDPVGRLGLGAAAGIIIVAVAIVLAGILRARGPRDLRGILAAGTATADRATGMGQSLTVVTEVALALALVTVTALLLRFGAANVETGTAADSQMVTVELASSQAEPEARALAFANLLDGVADIPGVEAESLSSPGAWLGMGTRDRVLAECTGCIRGQMLMPFVPAYPVHLAISQGFFESLGIEPIAGRLFDRTDHYDTAQVAIVNASFAAVSFGRNGPLGRQVQVGGPDGEWFTVVGVVPDQPARGVGAPRGDVPVLYLSTQQQPPSIVGLSARAAIDPATFAERVEAIAIETAPVTIRDAARHTERLDRAVAPLRWFGALFAGIAAAALALALHGVTSAVRARTRARRKELAVRAAVGASPVRALAHVMTGTARTVAAGVLLGGVASWTAGRAIQMRIGGMPTFDPATAAPLAAILVLAALVGALGPAIRASRASPARVFRE